MYVKTAVRCEYIRTLQQAAVTFRQSEKRSTHTDGRPSVSMGLFLDSNISLAGGPFNYGSKNN